MSLGLETSSFFLSIFFGPFWFPLRTLLSWGAGKLPDPACHFPAFCTMKPACWQHFLLLCIFSSVWEFMSKRIGIIMRTIWTKITPQIYLKHPDNYRKKYIFFLKSGSILGIAAILSSSLPAQAQKDASEIEQNAEPQTGSLFSWAVPFYSSSCPMLLVTQQQNVCFVEKKMTSS